MTVSTIPSEILYDDSKKYSPFHESGTTASHSL